MKRKVALLVTPSSLIAQKITTISVTMLLTCILLLLLLSDTMPLTLIPTTLSPWRMDITAITDRRL